MTAEENHSGSFLRLFGWLFYDTIEKKMRGQRIWEKRQ